MEIKITIEDGAAVVQLAAVSKWLNHYLKNSVNDPYYNTLEDANAEFTIAVPKAGTYNDRANGPVAFVIRDEAVSVFFEEVYWLEDAKLFGSEAPGEPVMRFDYDLFA